MNERYMFRVWSDQHGMYWNPDDIEGEACEGCEHNERSKSCALVLGGGEALRACADLLFKDCEIVPIGTKARLAELEAALREIVMLSTPDRICRNCKHCEEISGYDYCQCPFCGSSRLKFFSRISGGYERYYIGQIHCMRCGARGPIEKSEKMDFREHLSEHGTAELARRAFIAFSCEIKSEGDLL